MDSIEDVSTTVADQLGAVHVQKLRGNFADLAVHNGCARSHSNDSGFVTESDSTSHDSAEAVLIMSEDGMSVIPEGCCPERQAQCGCECLAKRLADMEVREDGTLGNKPSGCHSEVIRSVSNSVSVSSSQDCDGSSSGSGVVDSIAQNHICDNSDTQCMAVAAETANRQSEHIPQELQVDQSQAELQTLDSQSDVGLHDSQSNVSLHVCSKKHKLSVVEEETRTRSHSEPVAPTKGSLVTRKQGLKLDIEPVDITNKAGNNNDSPETNKKKGGSSKQSWLLRLFESKLFDMSIAITYLFNSKEQGVQTYIGTYLCRCTCAFNCWQNL